MTVPDASAVAPLPAMSSATERTDPGLREAGRLAVGRRVVLGDRRRRLHGHGAGRRATQDDAAAGGDFGVATGAGKVEGQGAGHADARRALPGVGRDAGLAARPSP